MRTTLISIVLGVALALAACQPAPKQEAAPAPPSQAEIAAAINQVRATYETAVNAGDAAAVAALFTNDAISMPPSEPVLMGKEAIQSNLQSQLDQFKYEITITQDEAVGAGDWAYGRGTYALKATPKAGGKAVDITGKYLNIMQHQPDGSWKIARHIWNSDSPPPAAMMKKK